jgi:hypothetical protein
VQIKHLKLSELTIIAGNVHTQYTKIIRKRFNTKYYRNRKQLHPEEENNNLAEIFPFEDDIIVIP